MKNYNNKVDSPFISAMSSFEFLHIEILEFTHFNPIKQLSLSKHEIVVTKNIISQTTTKNSLRLLRNIFIEIYADIPVFNVLHVKVIIHFFRKAHESFCYVRMKYR